MSASFSALCVASKKSEKKPQQTKTAQRAKVSGKWVFDNRENGFLIVCVGKPTDLTQD
jgi:hypothetical protein